MGVCCKAAGHSDAIIAAYPKATQGITGVAMDIVMDGYKGLRLLVWLNWDRIFTLGTVVVGLLAGAFLGSAFVQP